MVNATSRPLYPREGDPVPVTEQAEWASGTVRTGAENLASIGIRSPDLPTELSQHALRQMNLSMSDTSINPTPAYLL